MIISRRSVIYNVRNIQYNCSYIPDNLIDRSQDIDTFSLLTQHSSFPRDYTRGLITSDASGQYAPTPTRMCRCSRRIERSDVFAKRRSFQRALRRTCVNLRECACAYSARGRSSRRVRVTRGDTCQSLKCFLRVLFANA